MFHVIIHGICSRYPGVFYGIIKRAVINLGAGDFVSIGDDSWWIKDTHLMSPLKLWHTRFKIIRKVGGLKALDKEVERLVKLEQCSDVPLRPPKLVPTEQLCDQFWRFFPYPKTLGQILHEVGCPGVDPSSVYWVDAGPPSTEAGQEAREEIIRIIYRRWHYLRIRLIDKKYEILQNQINPQGKYYK